MGKEIWRDLIGYEGYYIISSFGNLISKNKYRGGNANLLIKHQLGNKNGYIHVHLSKDNKKKFALLHRLVAITFIKNPLQKPHINDGNKHNNNVSNLEWCTISENIKHSYTTLKRKKSKGRNPYKIQRVDKDGNLIQQYDSLRKAEKDTGVSRLAIIKKCRSEIAEVGGFFWKKV